MTPRLALLLLVLALVPAAADALPPRAEPEIVANSYTINHQFLSDVAAEPSGNFVVVWESVGQDGDNGGIFGQRFSAAGLRLGGEFQVNTYTTGRQSSARVAAADGGRFVVVWMSPGQDGSGAGVFGRVFDPGGPLGGEFPLATYTTNGQVTPSVSVDASGNVIAAWASDGADGASFGIRARRFAGAGTPLGPEIPVNGATAGIQFHPAVARAPDGSFVVAWDGYDGHGPGVFLRRFDPAGAPLGGEVQVNTYTLDSQDTPEVAPLAGGGFAVVWQSSGQDGSVRGVFGRRVDEAGSPFGGEIALNTYTYDAQQFPRVAPDETGGFSVVWEGWSQDGSLAGVFGRSVDAAGAPSGPEFRVNTRTIDSERAPAIAADAHGRFVVSWHSNGLDGGGYGVQVQRFGDLIFEDGFETGTLSAWSTTGLAAGDLVVGGEAALHGAMGLAAVVDAPGGLFVQDDSPGDERRYRARLMLDPNGFDPGEAELHRRTRVFIAFAESPTRRVAAVVLRRVNGAFALMGRARLDSNDQADTGFFPITDARHAVEIDLVRSSGPDANDGSFELWIDGVSVARLENLDNSQGEVDFARMGALSVKSAGAGTLYFDAFESRRESYMGPLP